MATAISQNSSGAGALLRRSTDEPRAAVGRARSLSVEVARSLLRALWLVVIPALVAGVALRYLVPRVGAAPRGWVEEAASFARVHPIEAALALFVVLAALAHYWRFHLPGGRFLAKLPLQIAVAAPLYTLGALETLASAGQKRGFWRPLLRVLVLAGALAAALLVRAHFMAYRVLSSSMVPTFQADDLLLGRRAAGSLTPVAAAGRPVLPKRGDIVVFRDTSGQGPELLIKRVVGLPGDEIIMNSGRPYINRWPVPKCDAGHYAQQGPDDAPITGRLVVEFLDESVYLTVHSPDRKQYSPYVVQAGEVFVVGDNRNASLDSRAWHEHGGSGVPLSKIVARVERSVYHAARTGRLDWSSLFESVGSLELHLDGIDDAQLRSGIRACLERAPTRRTPPALDTSAPEPTGFPLAGTPGAP